jgi:hypothetical protein
MEGRMRKSHITTLTGLVCTLLLTASAVSLELDPDAGFDYRERGLHIMRAYYGAEGHFVNVTERLRHMIDDGRIHTRVDNEHLGLDPDPHVHKVLRILYWYQGERRNIVVPEKAVLNLP